MTSHKIKVSVPCFCGYCFLVNSQPSYPDARINKCGAQSTVCALRSQLIDVRSLFFFQGDILPPLFK